MNISDYYLDINSLLDIPKDHRRYIIDFYRELLMGNISSMDKTSIFNTLVKSGYLINKNQEDREEKIDKVINE